MQNVLSVPRPKMIEMSRYVLLVVAFTFGVTLTLKAQSQSDGSVYSRFGLGERQVFFSSKSQAMGGGGYALSSTVYINASNPATLGDQILTRFAGGLRYESIKASADGFPSGRLASGSLSAIHLGFPIKSGRTGIGLTFAPYTRVAYKVDSESSLISDPETAASAPLLTSFGGSGGLQKLSAGLGHRFSNRFSLGLTADFVFGILEESQGATFNSSLFVDRRLEQSTRFRGLSATIGARYVVPGFSRGKALVLGAVINLPSSLNGERVQTLTTALSSDTLGTVSDGEVDLPFGIGFGWAYQPNPRWTLIGDVTYEPWSSFDSDFDLPGYKKDGASTLDDRYRFSIGTEYWPAAGRPFASYGSRIAYRLGLYSDAMYASPTEDEDIRLVGITSGLSLPSLIPGTTIDLNLDVGRRGTKSKGLIKEGYIRIGLNINFGERWFDRLPLG